ncbi:MAG TPA: general stress protein CsbD [Burkholderiales bacterium]|nr:general stress protein CsbD [Burkholderiales bacterium]
MNWSSIETGWNEFKANAKQQWGKLSDEQITDTLGKRENLSLRVQEAYTLSKEDTERQISDWQSKQVEKQAGPAKS